MSPEIANTLQTNAAGSTWGPFCERRQEMLIWAKAEKNLIRLGKRYFSLCFLAPIVTYCAGTFERASLGSLFKIRVQGFVCFIISTKPAHTHGYIISKTSAWSERVCIRLMRTPCRVSACAWLQLWTYGNALAKCEQQTGEYPKTTSRVARLTHFILSQTKQKQDRPERRQSNSPPLWAKTHYRLESRTLSLV